MSIEQLKDDWAKVKERAAEKFKTAALTTSSEIAQFMTEDFLPWTEAFLDEVAEIDESVGDLVVKQEDVLHEDNAEVFAGLITSGRVLIGTELRARCGNDRRLLKAIDEWMALSQEGEAVLNDITIPDPDDDEQPDAPDEPDAPDDQAGDA